EIVSKPAREAGVALGLSPASIYRLRQQLTAPIAREPKARIANLSRHLEQIGHDRARKIIAASDTLERAAAALDIGYTTIYKAMRILGVERRDRSDYRPAAKAGTVIEGVAVRTEAAKAGKPTPARRKAG